MLLKKQFLHYVFLGVCKNTIGYSAYLLITHHGINPKVAMSFLYILGTFIFFYLSRNFIFFNKRSVIWSLIRFLGIYFIGYLMNLGILVLMVDNLGYSHQIVQIFAIFFVAVFLFIAMKLYVFSNHF